MKKRILIVEDEPALGMAIRDELEFEGFEPSVVEDGVTALERILKVSPDLVILDLMLPGKSGFDVCREVRQQGRSTPIIMLTARAQDADKVRGLELGADDYVVKPFSVRELLARVEAVLRRSPERPLDVRHVKLPEGVADLERCEVRFGDGQRAELSEREIDLLRYLAANAGRAVSRDEILARVWRINPRGVSTRTIDMHIARLREKLRDDSQEPAIVLTVRGKGYMFAPGGRKA